MNGQRLFCAVPLPDDVKAAIAGVQDAVSAVYSHRGRTHPDALHVTLRFFGSVPNSEVATLKSAVSEALKEAKVFDTTLGQVSGFGPVDRPRVVVVSLKPEAPWVELAARVEAQVRRVGVQPERRPFRPHITIHRPKRPGTVPVQDAPPVSFPVQEVVLYESQLRPDRAHYRAVDRWALKAYM